MNYSQTQIAAAIAGVKTAGKTLRRAVEKALVCAVYDALANGSADTANALVKATPKSTKKDGIVGFLEQYAKLAYVSGAFAVFNNPDVPPLDWDEDYSDEVRNAAEDWEDFKPTRTVAKFDAVKALESAIKSGRKAGANAIHADLIDAMAALLAEYTARCALETINAAAAVRSAELTEAIRAELEAA